MSQDLNQNRYDQLVRRVGSLTGGGAKVSEVLAELFPVIEVESTVPELRILAGTILGLGFRSSAGAAAVHQQIQLFNPVDSGNIITVTSAEIVVGTAQAVNFGLVNTALASQTSTQRPRDGRVNILSPILGQIRFGNSAAVAPAVGSMQLALNAGRVLDNSDGLFVLPPGFGFQVTTTIVNTILVVTFWWRERVAEQSELSL